MIIAIVQTDPAFGAVEANIAQAESLIANEHADLYVLPELFATGYNFIDKDETASLADGPTGRTFQRMSSIAKRKSCYISYGFAEKSDDVYNSAALVGPEGLVGLYRKIHLFNREKLFFAPGDLGFPVFELPFGSVGMMICFDWIFPESARTIALGGADLIIHPSNLVMPHCPDAMVTRCLENGVYAATANRIGVEDRGGNRFAFIGRSEVVAPDGRLLVRLGNECGVGLAEVDLALSKSKRINEFNDLLADRRPEWYSGK
jgi:predicted amidohydrolase